MPEETILVELKSFGFVIPEKGTFDLEKEKDFCFEFFYNKCLKHKKKIPKDMAREIWHESFEGLGQGAVIELINNIWDSICIFVPGDLFMRGHPFDAARFLMFHKDVFFG